MTTLSKPVCLSADSICGDNVKNSKGEDLGEIKDLMLDVAGGEIAYAVLSFGGFLGMGDKYFAIPWDALTLDASNKCFILDVDKDRLKDAPGFDKNNWPNFADDKWHGTVHTFYGTTPRWT